MVVRQLSSSQTSPSTLQTLGRWLSVTLWSLYAATVGAVCSMLLVAAPALAQQIPHGQDQPPGPALSPEEALARMTVPEGFQVELVASEPQIVNPVAMTFDERGRIWITESLEYPRSSPGRGRDRVKILEDTDHDGRVDKVTVFADGLNIPSGIAVGHGGVWVANAPDLLFLRDTDGDDRADQVEVVVRGFGRHDTHELPNSLTWGPDGDLYGLNGVFNRSRIDYRGSVYDFTCAVFRIDPRTRDFELFAEGTSNPWGIAWNPVGDAFLSACVIDHLWHITESGYYHRQGGPYPPFTWKLGSIVKHKHQKAAYCGIHYFDSDAYPPEYRDVLFMGNIHGNCINADVLQDRGATYFAESRPDFLSANDPWFMPVVQKTGPDGCLYVLDWYDRYHCYQDARRDPEGIDRLKGRLYRVRYQDTPRAPAFDLATENDEKLIERLHSGNVYFRDIAQRLLSERLLDGRGAEGTRSKLQTLVLDANAPLKTRMHALWSLVGTGQLDDEFHQELLEQPQRDLRSWAVRAAGNMDRVSLAVREHVLALAGAADPRVNLQVAIAAPKLDRVDPFPALATCLAAAGDDPIIPNLVWQNLHPLLEDGSEDYLAAVARLELIENPQVLALMPRVVDRILAVPSTSGHVIAQLLELLEENDPETARSCLEVLTARVASHELMGERLEEFQAELTPVTSRIVADGRSHPLYLDAVCLVAAWGDSSAQDAARKIAASGEFSTRQRLQALEALVRGAEPSPAELDSEPTDPAATQTRSAITGIAAHLLQDADESSPALRAGVLGVLGGSADPQVAAVVLEAWPVLEEDVRPKAIELLTGRKAWSHQLLAAIGRGDIPQNALNVNQVRKLIASGDPELDAAVRENWGVIRTDRDPNREQLIGNMRVRLRNSITSHDADPLRGREVFRKVCAQCHTIYGEGEKVGPDITRNGRASFEQLLSNVFDPSLVIGAGYQPTTVVTTEGRVITGLLVEDNAQRMVLKVQGGKLETIARSEIEDSRVSQLSMMPEGLEKQLKPQELEDLFAYLTLDGPPEDPDARRIPGTREITPRETGNPREFSSILAEVMPGFSTRRSGVGGVALLAEHLGRPVVVRTHPVSREQPCVLTRSVDLPADCRATLVIDASHDPQGDWTLIVRVNGQVVHESVIGAEGAPNWQTIVLDLSPFAGRTVDLQLENHANGWSWEFAYWGRVAVRVESTESDDPNDQVGQSGQTGRRGRHGIK